MLDLPRLANKKKYKSIAVLSSGGDAPGMNAAIRAVVRYGIANQCEVYGIYKGYTGLLEGQIAKMNLSSVANTIQRGGTILKTSRCPAFHKKSIRREAAHILRRKGIEALVVVGGDGSFRGAHLLEKENGFPCIGVPGTIDNDIYGSDDTIGFDTAVNTALEAIDRIRDTASSHDRLFLIEVMGRDSGFIALQVGIGGGAESVIVPEQSQSIESVCRSIERGMKRGKTSSIIVVAEGPKPGLSARMAERLEKLGYGPRVCILGHTQRGGKPTAHDRFLASALGASAVIHLLGGHSNGMIGVRENEVAFVPFRNIFGKKKPFPEHALDLARTLAI
ncbi:MAG: 6-phosphofructokinase [Bacteriovoracia bacterium]